MVAVRSGFKGICSLKEVYLLNRLAILLSREAPPHVLNTKRSVETGDNHESESYNHAVF